MVCVAVTRGGAGDMWRFASLQAAGDHPLIQLGDALCASGEHVLETFTVIEMSQLAQRLGNPRLAEATRAWQSQAPIADRTHYAEQLWDSMRRLTAPPPEDPEEIVRLIRKDRALIRSSGSTVRLHPDERQASSRSKTRNADMTDEKTKTSPIRAKKFSDESVISFGKDAEGNAYGADNNPKKVGSKAAASFANYVAGETVKDLLARGGTTRNDVNYDVEKGYITLA